VCNIAGYIGNEEAAPILLELIERQEGFGGGYYTGIATVADGTLHHAKVVGDTATLRRETDAECLPGTAGIVHSRSKSGGDEQWAHPFVDCAGRMAYVANGSDGWLGGLRDKNAVAGQLAQAGHTFRSRAKGPIGEYPVLLDGACVHTSEVMSHLIESHIGDGGRAVEAMRAAYMEFPAEIVGLVMHADEPDCVVASRFNQPLMIGRGGHATYLATTAMAFPDEAGIDWLTAMPVNASAAVYRDRVEILPFDPPPGEVAGLLPWAEGREKMLEALSDGEAKGFGALAKATAPLWPEDAASQRAMMAYEILRGLLHAGEIRFEDATVPGVLDGTTAPQRRAILSA